MKTMYRSLAFLMMVLPFSTFASFINFDDYSPQGFSNQMVSGSFVTNGNELALAGNLWVSISDSFEIAADTILHFSIEGTGLNPEFFGIGLDNDNFVTAQTLFQLGGSDTTGANQIGGYTAGDGVVDYAIAVGDYFTGTFSKFVFILDNDAMPSGSEVIFSNVELCDSNSVCLSTSSSNLNSANAVNAPSVALLSLFALFFTIRKRIMA